MKYHLLYFLTTWPLAVSIRTFFRASFTTLGSLFTFLYPSATISAASPAYFPYLALITWLAPFDSPFVASSYPFTNPSYTLVMASNPSLNKLLAESIVPFYFNFWPVSVFTICSCRLIAWFAASLNTPATFYVEYSSSFLEAPTDFSIMTLVVGEMLICSEGSIFLEK